MTEFELIARFFKTPLNAQGVVEGIGDDCALLKPAPSAQLAVSVDTLVSEVHFPKDAAPGDIAQRALRVCLSDLAAMGAQARWFTLALTLPDVEESWLEAFSAQLSDCAQEFSCALVGGDTTRGPLTLSLQVMGEVSEKWALKRSAACVGDSIYVTGSLGDAAAALMALNEKALFTEKERAYLLERFYRPAPRFYEAKKISGLSRSAIDISDGLLADLGHICKQSAVGAELELQSLPVSEVLLTWAARNASQAQQGQVEQWALSGGDDYELCFTVSQQNKNKIDEMTLSGTLDATEIGRIVEGQGVQVFKQGEWVEQNKTGFQHFD